MSTEPGSLIPEEETSAIEKRDYKTLRVITWVSAGMAVAALGIYLGAELRSRAKFKSAPLRLLLQRRRAAGQRVRRRHLSRRSAEKSQSTFSRQGGDENSLG